MAKRILSEIDLLSNGIKSTPAKTAWEALSNGLVNIQQAMKYRETERIPDARSAENGRRHVITQKDVEDIVRYIKITINNCLSSTFPKLMFKESITKQHTNMKTNNKNVVRLTESDLHRIVEESVNRLLRENNEKQTIEAIPAYALPYLINADPSGLEDEDIQEIDDWIERCGITWVCPPDSDDEHGYFTTNPAFGKPCNVYDCVCFYD